MNVTSWRQCADERVPRLLKKIERRGIYRKRCRRKSRSLLQIFLSFRKKRKSSRMRSVTATMSEDRARNDCVCSYPSRHQR